MTVVTGLTAARMEEIEGASIVDGTVVGNNLILERHNGTTIDAGNVRGAQGIQGVPGEVTDAELAAHASAEVTARNNAIAAALAADLGWHHIDTAAVSNVSSFTIAIPSSIYKMVKVTLHLTVTDAAASVNARVNNDSTASLHRYSYTQQLGDGTLSGGSVDGTLWRLGIANTVFTSLFDMLIVDSNVNGPLPWQCVNTVFASTPANVRSNISSGRLASPRLLSSLVITPAAGQLSGFWLAQGYKV